MKYFLSSLVFAFFATILPIGTVQATVFVPPTTDRTQTQLNGTWKFISSNTLTGAQATGYNDSSWASVSVPHTWDSIDRVTHFSNSWYRTHFTISSANAGQRIYVFFEGAFQVADVYMNGTLLGEHRGGYTGFKFDATNAINFGGDNVLAVKVSSSPCSDALPDGEPRLWRAYGGIYRKAWIITANQYHVSDLDYSSNGIYVTQSNVSSASANVSFVTVVGNSSSTTQTFTVTNYVNDANQNIVLQMQKSVSVPGNSSLSVTQTGTVSSPHLWSKSSPYLYNIYATISANGAVTDAVGDKIGFRFYKLTTSDFTLNGVSDKLRGVSKHQETEDHATAVSDADLITDWNNFADLGVNYVRLPHYPHARLEYDLADQMGIMVWAEDGFTNSAAPSTNSENLVREMVYQNFNHPSIIFWSAGNEAQNTSYVPQYAQVIKAADPSRPTVYANEGTGTGNFANVDYEFINFYPGWYYGSMYDFARDGAAAHYVSESGAGSVITTHTPDYFSMTWHVGSFEPEEYAQLDNEVKFQTLFVNAPSTIPAFSNWTFRDFGDVKYKNQFNTKGLMTDANFKKDIYYHYKSFLSSSRVVHIVGADYFLRNANGNGQGDVKVYSNAPSMTLTVNGVSLGNKSDGGYKHPNGTVINHVFYWTNALSLGKNTITADDGQGTTDTITVYYKGSGSTIPTEAGSLVTNLTSSNSGDPAFYINRPIQDQYPIFYDFDGTGDNTFDVVPSILSGGASWIATKRQSNTAQTTNLAFNLAGAANVYIMCTDQGSTPSFISSAGFTDTGATGKWRDNNVKRVNYKLYEKSYASGSHVSLGSAAIDYVVLLQNAGPIYQTEDLVVASSTAGISHQILVDSRFSDGRGTEFFSNAVGDKITYVLPNVKPGTYSVTVGMKKYASRGMWQLSACPAGNPGASSNIGSPVDEYTPSPTFTSVNLGTWKVGTQSDKWFTFTITGKNASSTGYTEAFDYITLTPQ